MCVLQRVRALSQRQERDSGLLISPDEKIDTQKKHMGA